MPAPLFAFPPNWATPLRERLAWLTDVFEAHDGSEQRTALRSMPRRALAYQFAVQSAAAQQLDGQLWRHQARQWLLPLWTDPQRLTAGVPAGADTLPATTASYGFIAPGWAVLLAGALSEVVEITAIDTEGLKLSRGTQRAWPAGSLLYPAQLARLPADVNLQRLTAGLAVGAVEFELESSASPVLSSAAQYRSLEVSTWRPDWSAPIPAGYLRKIQRLDYELGAVQVDDLAGLPTLVRTQRHVLANRGEISAWRGWLHARAGRHAAFWQPQWQMDLTQAAPIGTSAQQLMVRSLDYAARYASDPGRQDLALRHRDGTWFFRRVIAASSSGDTDTLTLDAPLGISAAPGDFPIITWLVRSRLESDEQTLSWHTAGVAVSTLETRSLRA